MKLVIFGWSIATMYLAVSAWMDNRFIEFLLLFAACAAAGAALMYFWFGVIFWRCGVSTYEEYFEKSEREGKDD